MSAATPARIWPTTITRPTLPNTTLRPLALYRYELVVLAGRLQAAELQTLSALPAALDVCRPQVGESIHRLATFLNRYGERLRAEVLR